MTIVSPSPNLALNELIARRRRAGHQVVHLGFGESRLPVPGFLAVRLLAGAERNGYGQIGGEDDCRAAAAGYFNRRGIQAEPDQVVLAPGSKPILLALMAALPGAVVLPRPCWVTYGPQAALFGRPVIDVPVPATAGGVPDPDRLESALRTARARGVRPTSMILTLPDNPTGTFAGRDLVYRLADIAEREDLLIISDEIYRDIVHDEQAGITSPAELVPDRTVVTSGLSKSLALGGWRIGFARFPATAAGAQLRDRVLAVASEVWSSLAGPMQEVASYVLSEPADVRAQLAASTRLHARVAAGVYQAMSVAGFECRRPTAGFYLYPDLEPLRPVLARQAIHDSASLQHQLLERHGIAVLGGHHFGDDPAALRFRAATSMLYGDDAGSGWQALASSDPLSLPQIAGQLDQIRQVFAGLAGVVGAGKS